MLLLAHAGHWAVYVAAPLIVLAAVVIATIRERLRNDDPRDSESEKGLPGEDPQSDPDAQQDEPRG